MPAAVLAKTKNLFLELQSCVLIVTKEDLLNCGLELFFVSEHVG